MADKKPPVEDISLDDAYWAWLFDAILETPSRDEGDLYEEDDEETS